MASSTKLQLLHVLTAVDSLDYEQTKGLVIRLGVDLKVIKDIETDYKGSSNSRKIHTIQAWLDRDTEASWEKIVYGLEQIGMKVIARKVAELHCPHLVAATTPTIDSHQPVTVHPPQPINILAPLTPAMPSHIATIPVIDSVQSHNLPPNTTSTTPVSADQSYSPASDHSQPVALPPSLSTSSAHNTTSTTLTITTNQSLVPSPTCQPSTVIFWSLEEVKATILQLEDQFSDLLLDTEDEISEKECADKRFLKKFRIRILSLSVAKKCLHVKFFRENEDDIISAKDTRKIIAILCRYIDYRNYEILHHVVSKFCGVPLQENMKKYCLSLETFEMYATVDIYISAVPDEISEEIENGFSEMVVKINKPSSECTLHEVRKLNEATTTKSGLESHSVYISSVAKNCVVVAMRFPSSAVGWVLAAMTPDFIHTQHLTEITMDGKQLTIIQTERQELVCTYNVHVCLSGLCCVFHYHTSYLLENVVMYMYIHSSLRWYIR